MGNLFVTKEEMRDERVIEWLASSFQDLRHGLVLMRRDPGVSALIVLVLALGIGGNAAVFTLLKAAFLDRLPFRDAGRLVTIIENDGWIPTVSEFLEIQKHTRTLDGMAFAEHRDMQLSGRGEPTRVFAARVTASFFPLLGVNAALGRTFVEEENQPGRPPAVLLTDAFWRSRMGSDAAIVGRTLRLDGQPAVVVGVLPPGRGVPQVDGCVQRQECGGSERRRPRGTVKRKPSQCRSGDQIGDADVADKMRVERAGLRHAGYYRVPFG